MNFGENFGASFKLMRRMFAVLALAMGALLPACVVAAPAAGYWWNPATPGTGFVIEIQGSTMFMAGFLYDGSGSPTWVASNGPMTNSTTYSGSLITYHGGQSLTGAYQSATLTTPAIGTISIAFTSDTKGSVTWPGGAGSVTVPIQRYDIVPNGSTTAQPATNPQTGWWWNAGEGGRGFAVEVQNGNMYFAGYMYDTSGKPIWYLSNGPMTGTSTYAGQLLQYAGGQTLAGPYKAPTGTTPAGNVTLQIANNSVATLTLPDGRQLSFTRFDFGISGLTLLAFAPSASAPAQLLKITGTGFDPSQALSVTLSDAKGYSVTIPPVTETTGQFEISVPPYVNAATSVFGSGTVSVQASQGATKSNSLPGFQIQAVPKAAGAAGTTTLSLIRASLAEAQKLQTSIKNTPQDSAAVEDALARQVTNLQTLVLNVQSVVLEGQSFTLGAVGGVNITVTPQNISDVDSLIVATLQSLSSPGPGAFKSASQAGGTCMSSEAGAFAQGAIGGSGNTDALAQNFLEAACKSSLCQAPANFLPAYQLYSGAGSTGLGVINQGGFGTAPVKGSAAALLATLVGNSATSVVLNNLLCITSSSDQSTVKAGVADVTRLQQPTYNVLLPKTTGELAQTLTSALTVSNIIAPPPPSSAGGISGNWSGSFTVAQPNGCSLENHSWTASFIDSNGALSGNWIADDGSSGAISGIETGTAASWSTTGASGISISAAINGNQMIGNFTSAVQCMTQGPKQGTFFATKTASSFSVPSTFPTGTYSFSYSYSITVGAAAPVQASIGPIPINNTDAVAFAGLIQGDIDSVNSTNCGSGITCSANVTAFNGTTFQVVFVITGPNVSGNITYILTKTG